jgi:hypothetical protein
MSPDWAFTTRPQIFLRELDYRQSLAHSGAAFEFGGDPELSLVNLLARAGASSYAFAI